MVDIEKAKAEKANIERMILNTIHSYERMFGVSVTNISITHVAEFGQRLPHSAAINLTVEV
jgi:hypothetical protein